MEASRSPTRRWEARASRSASPRRRSRAMRERILVVDDEQNARTALHALLTEEGYEVEQAANGADALERVQSFAPAVILSDLRMPKMDGMQLLQQLKERGSDASVVVMTAFGSVQTAVEVMKAGAENFLTKPLELEAVL